MARRRRFKRVARDAAVKKALIERIKKVYPEISDEALYGKPKVTKVTRKRDVSTSVAVRQPAAEYFAAKNYAVHFEIGLAHGVLRADILATNLAGYIVMCEVKSSVADFRADKKWQRYLPYCNKFYFVMSPETYAKVKDEIPNGIGVFISDGNTGVIKKRANDREVSDKLRLEVITRMAYRAASVNNHSHKNVFESELGSQLAFTVTNKLRKEYAVKSKDVKAIQTLVQETVAKFAP